MKPLKIDYTLDELKDIEGIPIRTINCSTIADIHTANQLVTFYNDFGTFLLLPNCGLISHYEMLRI